ncbi:MAG: tRNA (adenosine(37)-N6)-dimethylallyltransferase MiaA [Bacteroidales bacterium]
MTSKFDLITLLGHTAAGKTALAAHLAQALNGEVISADSRQVYRGMTIGTGKDYEDYEAGGEKVPYHLVDIMEPGTDYNVFEFQKDFLAVCEDLVNRKKLPVLCGGSGLYVESVLRQYTLLRVPVNEQLRLELEYKAQDELINILEQYGPLHNRTDTMTRSRTVRAIEIADYMQRADVSEPDMPELNSLTIGIAYARDVRRSRISERLKQRLELGMIEEAEALLAQGVSHEKLEYYGLEYKFMSRYLRGELSEEDMFSQLNTAIHQFAKRQMTYFRGMERRGIPIHWIDGLLPMEEKLKLITDLYFGST